MELRVFAMRWAVLACRMGLRVSTFVHALQRPVLTDRLVLSQARKRQRFTLHTHPLPVTTRCTRVHTVPLHT